MAGSDRRDRELHRVELPLLLRRKNSSGDRSAIPAQEAMTRRVHNMNGWERTTTEIKSIDWKGKPIVISNVPAKRYIKTGRVRVDPIEVARAEARQIAED